MRGFLHDLGDFYFNISSQLSIIVLNWFQFDLGITSQNIETNKLQLKVAHIYYTNWGSENTFDTCSKFILVTNMLSGFFPLVNVIYK